MSIGSGLFLFGILISIIYLGQKVSKLMWLKVIKILSLFILGVPLITWLCMLGYNKYETHPQKSTEYWGVNLGDSASQVRFSKGDPVDHFGKSKWNEYRVRVNSKDLVHMTKTSDLDVFWLYEDGDKLIQIEFSEDKLVKNIFCFCTNNSYSCFCPSIFSIGIGSGYNDIVSVFGHPSVYKDGEYGDRFLQYPQYNVMFKLKENQVLNLGLFKDIR